MGFGVLNYEDDSKIIAGMYIGPEFTGKGIGSKIMEELSSHFGDEVVSLEVAAFNAGAIKFYKRFGFKVVEGSESNHDLKDGKYIPIVKMVREERVN